MTASGFAPFTHDVLRGQVAMVTGAGGHIGGAIARRLHQLGATVALVDLRPDRLHALQHELIDRTHVLAGDLTFPAEVQRLTGEVVEHYGRVDILVNAAGLLRTTSFAEITKSEWDLVMDANLGTAFLMCQAAAPLMLLQRSGRIVNFSSVAGQVGGILSGAHYAASKAGVISLTRSLAKLLGPHGITCNAVAPAGVESEMLDQYDAEQKASLITGIPAGRFGTPAEIAELVCWLASPAAAYINGQTIGINGGSYLG